MSTRASLAVAAKLLMISGSGILASNILLPAIPFIASSWSLPIATISVATAYFSGGYALAHVAYALIPTHVGTKSILGFGLALLLSATIGLLAAPTLALFLASALFMGAGAAAAPALLPSLIADAYQDAGSASTISMLAALEGVLPPLAALAGAFVCSMVNWRTAFLLIIGAILVSALVLPSLRAGNQDTPPDNRSSAVALNAALKDTRSLLLLLSASSPFCALLVAMNLSPAIFAAYYHSGPSAFGFMQIFTVTFFIAGTVLSTRIAVLRSINSIDAVGLCLMVLSAICMACFHATPEIYVAALLPSQMGFGLKLGPVLNEALMISANRRATSILFGLITFGLAGVTTYWVIRFVGISPLSVAAVYLVFAMMGLVSRIMIKPSALSRASTLS